MKSEQYLIVVEWSTVNEKYIHKFYLDDVICCTMCNTLQAL